MSVRERCRRVDLIMMGVWPCGYRCYLSARRGGGGVDVSMSGVSGVSDTDDVTRCSSLRSCQHAKRRKSPVLKEIWRRGKIANFPRRKTVEVSRSVECLIQGTTRNTSHGTASTSPRPP